MNKTFKFRKIFRAFLSIVLIFAITSSFSGCQEKGKHTKTSSSSQTDKVSEVTKKGAEYTVVSAFYPCRGHEKWEQVYGKKDEIKVGQQLERIIRDYKDEEVFLDLIFVCHYKSPIADINKFAADIKAKKISGPENQGDALIYHIIGTVATVENIKNSEYKGSYVDINWSSNLSKPEGYGVAISVSMSRLLEQMGNEEKIQVLVITVADKSNRYSNDMGHNLVGEGRQHSMDNFNKLKGGSVLSYSEYEELTKKYILQIIERNNILQEKIIKTDTRVGLVYSNEESYNGELKKGNVIINTLVSGFTAMLTKSEILALAEDEDVKVIHNDTVISTYTVYDE